MHPMFQQQTEIGRKVVKIERTAPRVGTVEEPELTARGYCLADPKFGAKKHYVRNAVFVRTLDEAAVLLSRGFSLRMVGKGKRASLVAPTALRIIRA